MNLTYAVGDYGYPAATQEGVRCGNCSTRHLPVRHTNAEAVRMCYSMARADQAEQLAEQAAERALERHFEDRGWADALAQRDWEDRNGVIQFDDALRAAEADWGRRTGNLVIRTRGLFQD